MLIGERNLMTDDFLPFTELPEDFLCKAKGLTGSEQSKSISSYLFLQILEHVESSNNRIALVNRLNFWSLSIELLEFIWFVLNSSDACI